MNVLLRDVESAAGISVWEITSHIREMLKESGVKNGFVNVISRHTTTGSSDTLAMEATSCCMSPFLFSAIIDFAASYAWLIGCSADD
jgi:hypothetical protein